MIKFTKNATEEDKKAWLKFFNQKPKRQTEEQARASFAGSVFLKVLNNK